MFRKVEFMEKLLNDHMPYAGGGQNSRNQAAC